MEPRDRIDERFEVERVAGRGGMGTVYRAVDLTTGAPVALKLLRGFDERVAQRFAREARLLAELRHDAIVRYVAHGVAGPGGAAAGQPYLAMEWLEGEDLASLLARRGVSLAETVALGVRVADALGYAHGRGVVHRDLKPGNLFLRGGDVAHVTLLDFGIAALDDPRDDAATAVSLTRTGTMMGTPGYMAPEQARGERDVDPRADVFALGCVLHRCLLGREPFVGPDVLAVLMKTVLEEVPRVAESRGDVPAALDALIARMLAKARAGRPANCALVAAELRALRPLARDDGEEPAPLRPSDNPPALTTSERQVRCVVVARPAALASDARGSAPPPPPTTPGAPVTWTAAPRAARALRDEGDDDDEPTLHARNVSGAREQALRVAVERAGCRLEFLADGSMLATVGPEAHEGASPQAGADAHAADAGRGGEAGTGAGSHAPGPASIAPGSGGTAVEHATRAARCALAMRAILPDDVAIAVVAGRSDTDPRARVRIGEVVDRAVRLLGATLDAPAAGSPVRVDEVLAGLLDARFELGGDGRGLVLRGERDLSQGTRKLLGRATPCVGRERELAVLAGMLAECVEESVARAVLVTAPAGVGKSRVRYEFARAVAAQHGGAVEVWLARGDPMSAGSPFAMVSQLVRRAAGVRDGEALGHRQSKLRARVGRHVAPRELARVASFVAELAGAPLGDEPSPQEAGTGAAGAATTTSSAGVLLRAARGDPQLMGDQMRRAWEDWLAAECAHHPVLLVLEDLHWGDLPSVRFIDGALRTLADRPLMALALARPEVHELFPQLWATRGVQEVRLGELTPRAAARLVRAALGEQADEALVARLVERAAGNAFYLEELVRAVAEARGPGGRAHPGGGGRAADGASDELPDTVLAMVQSRLAALEPEARRVLRAASVFGQAFWRDGVAALLGGGTAPGAHELDGRIATLAARELIERRDEGRFPGEVEYVFRHALVRDAAYDTLTDEDRALGHRLAGAWLERAGESDAGALASHFERGAASARIGAQRARAFARAAHWYLAAAEQALEGNDYAEVVARAERGAACARSACAPDAGAQPAAGGPGRASGAGWRFDHEHARELEATRAEARATMGELLRRAAEAHRWRGEYAAATRDAQAAVDALFGTAARDGDGDGDGGGGGNHGRDHDGGAAHDARVSEAWVLAMGEAVVSTSKGGEERALIALAERLDGALPERARDPAQVVAVARCITPLFQRGQYALAGRLAARLEGAEREPHLRDNPVALARVSQARAICALHDGDASGYVAHSRAGVSSFEAAGDLRNMTVQLGNLGHGYGGLGAHDDAERALRDAIAVGERIGLSAAVPLAQHNLGLVLSRLGRHDEAQAVEQAAIDAFASQGLARMAAASRLYLAMILGARGEWDAAERAAREAVAGSADSAAVRACALAQLARVLLARDATARPETAAAASSSQPSSPSPSPPPPSPSPSPSPPSPSSPSPSSPSPSSPSPSPSRPSPPSPSPPSPPSPLVAEALAVAREGAALLEAAGHVEEGEGAIRLALAEALFAAGHAEPARAELSVARERLRAQAARIRDGAQRASFLADVPDHARILALAAAWGLPP